MLRGFKLRIIESNFSKKRKSRKCKKIEFWPQLLKIKGIKVYSSKQAMTNCGSIKTKMYKWRLTLATLWYKIEDHQDLSSSLKWRIFTISSTMKCKSFQTYFLLSALKHNLMGNSETLLYLFMCLCLLKRSSVAWNHTKWFSPINLVKLHYFQRNFCSNTFLKCSATVSAHSEIWF